MDNNLEELYQRFNQVPRRENSLGNQPWGTTEEGHSQSSSRQKDLERLEEEIESIHANRKFLNQFIAIFFAASVSSAGINAMTIIGLPMIATGTVGGIVIAVFFANTVSKIKLEGGKPKLDGEFIGSGIQTIAVMTAAWTGCKEQREVAKITKIGKERFIQEVKEYEKKPQAKENPIGGGAFTAVCFLLLALGILLMTKGEKKKI
jgi:hypothetical protein